jgi:hypothetical protein
LKANKNRKSLNPSTPGDKNEGSRNPPRNAKKLEKRRRKSNQLERCLRRDLYNLEHRRIQSRGSPAVPVLDDGLSNQKIHRYDLYNY